MNMIRRALSCVVEREDALSRDGEPVARGVLVTASTDTVDRYGESVRQDWLLDNYKRNPVVLYGHDAGELPIGKATDVAMVDGKLKARIEFAPTEKAQEVAALMRDGFLNSVSVGFVPRNVQFEVRDGREVPVLSGNDAGGEEKRRRTVGP